MTSITTVGADSFSITDNAGHSQVMSGEMLMQLLAMRGSQVCANELQVQMQKSNSVLDEVERAERYAAQMDNLKEQAGSGTASIPRDMANWMSENGIETPSGSYSGEFNKAGWEYIKENAQAFIHRLNGQSQMDYINLQSLTNQNNRLFSLMDAIETKSNQTKSEIIRDLK